MSEGKRPSRASDAVRIIIALLLSAIVGLCIASWPDKPTGSTQADKRAAVCTQDLMKTLDETIKLREPGKVFVDRLEWGLLTYKARDGFARSASLCLVDGSSLDILDAATGVRLGKYGAFSGFEAVE